MSKPTIIAQTVENLISDSVDLNTTRLFDKSNPNWTQTPEYNYLFLRGQQQFFNMKLAVKGHVMLNEVYAALGFPETPYGAIAGWIGQNSHVSIMTAHEMQNSLGGQDIILDFNIHGVVFDQI